MPTIETPFFPCWGRHSRMGYNVIVGEFSAFQGTSVLCRIPALPADPDQYRLATPERLSVVPMDGPAFFGFDVLSEAEAMAALLDGRPFDYDARDKAREDRRLLTSSADAVEVEPKPCAECGRSTGHHNGCPEDDDDALFGTSRF